MMPIMVMMNIKIKIADNEYDGVDDDDDILGAKILKEDDA